MRKKQADKLGIPHYVLDARKAFEKKVIAPFIAAYQAGCTPNPCVICNRKIKFALLFDLAREKGYDFIATGHYGAIVRDAYSGRYLIRTAAYRSKDQSYVLYNLTQEQLSRLILPLSGMTKPQVRKLAEKLGFAVSDKPDSQDICFIDGSDYAGFIRRYSGQQEIPGDFGRRFRQSARPPPGRHALYHRPAQGVGYRPGRAGLCHRDRRQTAYDHPLYQRSGCLYQAGICP